MHCFFSPPKIGHQIHMICAGFHSGGGGVVGRRFPQRKERGDQIHTGMIYAGFHSGGGGVVSRASPSYVKSREVLFFALEGAGPRDWGGGGGWKKVPQKERERGEMRDKREVG